MTENSIHSYLNKSSHTSDIPKSTREAHFSEDSEH